MNMEEQGQAAPCPFCGYFANAHSRNAKGTASGKHYFVRCPICHTEGPRSTVSEANAIAEWNKRAVPPAEQDGCDVSEFSGGECQRGTRGCIKRHAVFAPVKQKLVTMLTEDEITGCYGHTASDRFAINIQRACAKAWGLTIKEHP